MPINIGAGFERGPEIKPGNHTLTLTAIRVVEGDNPYFKKDKPISKSNNPKNNRLVWDFVTDEVDPATGKPYEYAHWTNDNYGDSRASLTKLLDFLVPGITVEQAKGMDVEELIGKRYAAFISTRKNQKGNVVPDLAFAKPLVEDEETRNAREMQRAAADNFDPDRVPSSLDEMPA